MRIFPGWWQRNFLLFEGLVVLVCGVAGVVYGYYYGGNETLEGILGDNRENVYATATSAFTSLFGFVIAATSIIVGVSGKERLTVVWENEEGWRDLWKTLFSTIRWLGVAALFALMALVLDRYDSPRLWLAHAVLILTMIVIVRLWRSVWVLEEIIKLIVRRPRGNTSSAPAKSTPAPRV